MNKVDPPLEIVRFISPYGFIEGKDGFYGLEKTILSLIRADMFFIIKFIDENEIEVTNGFYLKTFRMRMAEKTKMSNIMYHCIKILTENGFTEKE